jgi:hypothetical protein
MNRSVKRGDGLEDWKKERKSEKCANKDGTEVSVSGERGRSSKLTTVGAMQLPATSTTATPEWCSHRIAPALCGQNSEHLYVKAGGESSAPQSGQGNALSRRASGRFICRQ